MIKILSNKIKIFLKEHYGAVFFAGLTALIIAFPQMYLRIDHQELYVEGVEAIELLPDSPWSPRIREVQDGHLNFGSIYHKEGKDDPYLLQPLGSIIVGLTGKLFGFGINNTLLLAKVVYSFLTFLLIYAFVFYISKHKRAALASTSLVLLAEPVLSPAGLKRLVHGTLWDGTSAVNFLELSAPVNPAMIFIFLFGFLFAFWQFYERKSWRWGALSVLLLGLNVYIYFYSATYLFAFIGILGLFLILQKNWCEVRRISYVFFGGLVLAVPYAVNLYKASHYPAYEEVGKRFALLASHTPQFIGVVAFLGIVIFLVGFPRTNMQRYIFAVSLLLTPFITLNQQIVTGKILQAGHYHWYMHRPIAIIFALLTFFYLLDRVRVPDRYKKLIAILIIMASVGIGSVVQFFAYSNTRQGGDGGQNAIERQKFAPVMHWLNEHAEKEAVIFANEETSRMIGIYTPLNIYHLQVAHVSLIATDARVRELMFTYYRLRGVDENNAAEIFNKERAFISAQLFGLYYREKEGHDDAIPDEIIESVIEDYKRTLLEPKPEWLYAVWKKYQVEYLVWNTKEDPSWDLDQYIFLSKEATIGDFVIYSFPGIKLK